MPRMIMRMLAAAFLILILGCSPRDCPCGGCADKAHEMAVGACASCGGSTPYCSDKVCANCATTKKLCQHCGRPLPKLIGGNSR